MSKCENCVHYDCCLFLKNKPCLHYKDKSLCVEISVRVGQIVYVPWEWNEEKGIATVTVEEIKLYDTNTSHYMFFIDMESDVESYNQSFGGWKTEQSIGKTVFLDRAEAERKLSEVGE